LQPSDRAGVRRAGKSSVASTGSTRNSVTIAAETGIRSVMSFIWAIAASWVASK
jgi:hypothetical protein